MSKNIKLLLSQKLAENNARHNNADQETFLDTGKVFKRIPLENIEPNPYQPRKIFGDQELSSLTSSIEEVGLLQPITVKENGENSYYIVAGERRYRAHKHLNKTHIDALIIQANDAELSLLALAENIERADLADYEIGLALKELEKLLPNKSKMAKVLGINREDMYRYFSYEALPKEFIDKLVHKPHLLSRTAATQIKKTLKELDLPESQTTPILMQIWEQLLIGKIEQTKIADYLRKTLMPKNKSVNDKQLSTPLINDGKSIGSIYYKANKMVIELDEKSLTDEQKKALEQYTIKLVSNN